MKVPATEREKKKTVLAKIEGLKTSQFSSANAPRQHSCLKKSLIVSSHTELVFANIPFNIVLKYLGVQSWISTHLATLDIQAKQTVKNQQKIWLKNQ